MFIPEDHIALNTHEKIAAIAKPLIENTYFNTFKYTKISREGSYTYLSNHREWTKYYLENQLFNTGVFEQPHCSPQGCHYFLWEPINDSIFQQGKTFNINNGISLVKDLGDSWEIFHYGSSLASSEFSNYAINKLFSLEEFCAYFKSKAMDLTNAFEEEALHIDIDTESTQHNQSLALSFHESDRYLQCITKNSSYHLTAREKACLRLFSQGLSAKEAGRVLSLSDRTVEAYLNNAKKRMSCKNIAQLLVLSIRHGLI